MVEANSNGGRVAAADAGSVLCLSAAAAGDDAGAVPCRSESDECDDELTIDDGDASDGDGERVERVDAMEWSCE